MAQRQKCPRGVDCPAGQKCSAGRNCPSSRKCTAGHARLASDLVGLFLSGANADVTFIFPDGEIQAHKMILTTRVPYFEKMFASGMKESLTNRVELPEVDRKSYDIFLRYVYGGQLPKDLKLPKDVESLLNFAELYDVPSLVPDCLQRLGEHLSNSNFEKCIKEAARIMATCKMEIIRSTVEEELVNHVLRALPINGGREDGEFGESHCDNCHSTCLVCEGPSYNNDSPDSIDQLVRLLILAQSEKCAILKEKCLECLVNWRGFEESLPFMEKSLKKLGGHPDVLVEMVMRYQRMLLQ